jgi:hypothetical protein
VHIQLFVCFRNKLSPRQVYSSIGAKPFKKNQRTADRAGPIQDTRSNKENIMRKIILLGTTGLVLALGAVGAHAIPLDPAATPYALWNGQARPSSAAQPMTVGRAAFISNNADDSAPAARPRGNGPAPAYRGE